jgi:hypothetical protein
LVRRGLDSLVGVDAGMKRIVPKPAPFITHLTCAVLPVERCLRVNMA